MTTTQITETLNDLIQINNDRIEGYEKAVEELKDGDLDLKSIFTRMADESRKYKSELTSTVLKHGGDPADGSTLPGKIYRAWMDIKATFSGDDRKSALQSCEFGEDAAQKAYKEALKETELDAETRQLISTQQAALKDSHDLIKSLRDSAK